VFLEYLQRHPNRVKIDDADTQSPWIYSIILNQDVVKGLALARESAAEGSMFGQFVLGSCLYAGRGVAKDNSEAVRLWRLAAAQGHAGAQFNLGAMFANGEDVEKDDAKAVELYRLAAAQGDASAQNNLGVMFEKGPGVAKDRAEALSASSMPLLPANPAVRAPDLQEDEVTCVACVDKRSVGLGRNKRDQNAGSSSSIIIRGEGFH
jgi:hypothetical protein